MDTADPQSLTGYAYGDNNPVTLSDPTGLWIAEGNEGGWIDSGGSGGTKTAANRDHARQRGDGGIRNLNQISQGGTAATDSSGNTGTSSGKGTYYENDTPLESPRQNKEDDRPFNTVSWLTQWWNQDFDLELWSYMRAGAAALRKAMHFSQSADLLDHWLDATGDAFQISAKKMLNDLPGLRKLVNNRVSEFELSGSRDSGWQQATVADFLAQGDKGAAVQDWWYALNGFQYRVKVGERTVTLEIFKRYNWGNPVGGKPRNNVGIFHEVRQNDLARLHTDGYAQDFNVWGSYSYSIGG